jgi:crotonobetainyl-CoA:carnitine CoA-transferase CaiB-like acyl-CoA transferase
MGLAIAAGHETSAPAAADACVELVTGPASRGVARDAPRVVDLSGLWAGPLAAHLLWLAGADVVKVESRTRPDGMRANKDFYALLNQGKASVVLDLADANDRHTLLCAIAAADIVIEAARPRALAQLGIDAAQIVRTTPGLVWLTITGHGAAGDAANWVGFGDDCAVSGGLSAALNAACGQTGFVGDAIGDPLTGLYAALVAWEAWAAGRGGRFGLSMSRVVAGCLAEARRQDTGALDSSLRAWSHAAGQPFPTVKRRPIGAMPALGEQTGSFMLNHRGAKR